MHNKIKPSKNRAKADNISLTYKQINGCDSRYNLKIRSTRVQNNCFCLILETSMFFRPNQKKIAASFLLETRSYLIVFVSISETCSFVIDFVPVSGICSFVIDFVPVSGICSFLFLFRLASAFGYPKQPMVPARFCKIGYFSTLQMLHFQFCNQQHIIRRICKRK